MSSARPVELRRAILADFDRLMQHVAHWRELELADVAVTMPQARCLLLVGLHPALTISALAAHLRVGLPAASGLVDRLVEHGYVERNVDPTDRRHQLVTLSGPGRQLVGRLRELSSDRLGDLLAGLTEDELKSLRLGIAALEREARIHVSPSGPPDPERTPA